jgi:hypothetical protein
MNRGIRPVPLYTVLGHQVALGYLVNGDITTTGSAEAALWLLFGIFLLHAHRLAGLRVWWAIHTGPKAITTRRDVRLRATQARQLTEWAQGRRA